MKVDDLVFLIKAYNNLLPSSVGTIKKISKDYLMINWYVICTDLSTVVDEFNTPPTGYLREYNTSWLINMFFTEYAVCFNTQEEFSNCIRELNEKSTL